MTRILKRHSKISGRVFGASLGVVLCLFASACSTKPVQNNRHGLLDHDAEFRAQAGIKSENPNELYAPKEGETIHLSGKWRWPLDHVEISSTYGDRGRKFHQGIDLRARVGTKVFAASDGQVTYVGSKIRGYGRMIVLKHPDGFFTVYAHHSKNLVRLGKKVHCGDLIAYSGKSGHAHGPHLHFEIRKGTQSFDPGFALSEFKTKDPARSVAGEPSSKQDLSEE